MSELQRVDIPVGEIVPNDDNPNKMSARQFDLLVSNIQETGLTEAVVVVPREGKYRIVSGHHRYEAAKYLGYEAVPCTVITDPDFDEDRENFQLVRMNVIKGKLDPDSFFNLYAKLKPKYTDEVMQDLMGFADDAEFKKLIKAMSKDLPAGMKEKFQQAALEIKTIDGLAKLLNTLFTRYGDTIPYGYMIFDYGGKDSIWLRMSQQTKKAMYLIADVCVEESRTMDDVLGYIIRKIGAGELGDVLVEAVEKAPVVDIAQGFAPTLDNVEAVASLK